MKISNAEQQILQVLWQEAPLTVGQIIERVKLESEWHDNTIKTMLTRLTIKGVIERNKDGKRYFYHPLVSKDEVLIEETEGLLSRFFEGKMAPLVAHFAKHKKLSKDDLNEIESILAKLKNNND